MSAGLATGPPWEAPILARPLAPPRRPPGGTGYETPEYRDAFWKGAGATVITRREEGIGDLASVWYSAWIAAGKPKLDAAVMEIEDTAQAAGIPHDR